MLTFLCIPSYNGFNIKRLERGVVTSLIWPRESIVWWNIEADAKRMDLGVAEPNGFLDPRLSRVSSVKGSKRIATGDQAGWHRGFYRP